MSHTVPQPGSGCSVCGAQKLPAVGCTLKSYKIHCKNGPPLGSPITQCQLNWGAISHSLVRYSPSGLC